jgi:peptidyl-prolyl cis-trans isomerase B (cyclophilin B)
MRSLIHLGVLGLLLAVLTACHRGDRQQETNSATTQETNAAAKTEASAASKQPTNPAAATTPAPTEPAKETNAVTTKNANEVAVIKTAFGDMVIEFWPDVAPNTVANFIKLAKQGFYDGTAFHRVIRGFMIQGGDPLSKTDDPNVGTGGPGYSIKAEFNSRPHVRGVISMARSANPDSAGCQFFVCLGDADSLNGKYTAFGKLIKGDDVLGKIGDTPVTDNGQGERSRPVTRMGVESIKIVPADSVK